MIPLGGYVKMLDERKKLLEANNANIIDLSPYTWQLIAQLEAEAAEIEPENTLCQRSSKMSGK